MNQRPGPASEPANPPSRRLRSGSLRISLAMVVVGLALVGSLGYIAWVVREISDDQIPMLATGFVVLGASLAAIAIGALVGMWRAASRARGGRALALAILGGLAGLAAIGAFTIAALSALVSGS